MSNIPGHGEGSVHICVGNLYAKGIFRGKRKTRGGERRERRLQLACGEFQKKKKKKKKKKKRETHAPTQRMPIAEEARMAPPRLKIHNIITCGRHAKEGKAWGGWQGDRQAGSGESEWVMESLKWPARP